MISQLKNQSSQVSQFDINLAVKLGNVGLAVLVEFFATQISINKASGSHEEDGRIWYGISKSALVKIFPWWTESQVRCKIEKLVAKGILMVRYEEGTFNRTARYAFINEAEFVKGE